MGSSGISSVQHLLARFVSHKNVKPFLLAALLLAGTSAFAQTRKPDFGQDWPKIVEEWRSTQPLENELELNQTPLFSNAPFLTLKDGDRLVEGQKRWRNFKAGSEELLAPEIYLRRGEKLISCGARRNGKNIILESPVYSHLFEWTFSPEHAQTLRSLEHNANDIAVSSSQWAQLQKKLKREWPSSLKDEKFAPPRVPFVEDNRMIWEELVYDNWNNRLLFRRTSIGTKGMWSKNWFLAVGPSRVDSFDIEERRAGVINGPRGFLPGELERNRRNYATQQKFRALIGELLPSVQPTKSLPENDMARLFSPTP